MEYSLSTVENEDQIIIECDCKRGSISQNSVYNQVTKGDEDDISTQNLSNDPNS